MNFLKQMKLTRCINATVAGVTTINGTHVDMQGFDGVVFIAALGALTATQVTKLKVQSGAASDDSDMADVTNAVVVDGASTTLDTLVGPPQDSQSNFLLASEVYRPQKRYLRPVVVRGTANAVIDSVVAIQYKAAKSPTTHDASSVAATGVLVF